MTTTTTNPSIELFPYQKEGVNWLSGMSHALLADEMGLGKSAQIVRAADEIDAKRILVVCPASARINWEREFQKFSEKSRIFQVISSKKQTINPEYSLIVSYDLTTKLRPKELGRFDLLVLDESHFLKGLDAKRTSAIFGRSGLIRICTRTWCVSGTPAPNHVGELWTMLYTFGVTKLSYQAWVKRYCTGYIGPHGFTITGSKKEMIHEVREMLNKVMLRRKKDEVLKDLPPIFYQTVFVEADEVDIGSTMLAKYIFPKDLRHEFDERLVLETKQIEEAMEKDFFSRDFENDQTSLRALIGLSKSVSTVRMFTALQKLNNCADTIASELANFAYDKVVIFAIHRDIVEGLRVKLKEFGAVTVYGGTPPEKRQRHIDSFQNNPKTRVFIGNIGAAGTAITLTAAHQVVFVELDWVPGNNAQAAARCHRIGTTKPLTVRYFCLSNSIDEKVSKALIRKSKELQELFL